MKPCLRQQVQCKFSKIGIGQFQKVNNVSGLGKINKNVIVVKQQKNDDSLNTNFQAADDKKLTQKVDVPNDQQNEKWEESLQKGLTPKNGSPQIADEIGSSSRAQNGQSILTSPIISDQKNNNSNNNTTQYPSNISQVQPSQKEDVGKMMDVSKDSLDILPWEERALLPYDQIPLVKDGPPRVCSPIIPGFSKDRLRDLPLMLYLPGIDGTGFAIATQFQTLAKDFDVKCFTVPPSDRTPFTDLVAIVKEYLVYEASDNPISRPIYILGDSFGALLAMAVAFECSDFVDRVILVNPPSSYLETPWPYVAPLFSLIPDELFQYVPLAILPMLVSPGSATTAKSPMEFAQQLTEEIQKQLPQVLSLPTILPVDTLVWKFKCLQDGCEYMNSVGYKNIQQRTLIITGDLDLLVPSRTEGPRLEQLLPRAQNVKFSDRSHKVIQDQDVDLPSIIKENNFYITSRNMSSFPKGKNGAYIRSGNNYAKAGPIEIPSIKEIDSDRERVGFNLTVKAVSPCFFSTDQNGIVSEGLQNVPEGEQLLFIGNHQPFPLDFSFIVEKVLRERGTLVRALAHPIVFNQFVNNTPKNQPTNDLIPQTMVKYGVVPVSPNNMYKLMQLGESVMLLPGGALEATKSKKMKHKLIWPENAEFVRMASKFNVTIVPFSAIGGEEYIEVLSKDDILQIPIIGDMFQQSTNRMLKRLNPRAWQGQAAGNPSPLIPGLTLPGTPARYYIKFGNAIKTDNSWVKDKEKCQQIYSEVKNSVQSGMDYLLLKRKEDPYSELLPRLLYEASWNFQRQAPTFKP